MRIKNCDFNVRLKVCFIDWIFIILISCSVFQGAIVLLELLFNISNIIKESKSAEKVIELIFYALVFIVLPIFKNLACHRGSIGCAIMNVRLVDMKTNSKTSIIKLMLRGLVDYIVPIDVIISKKRLDNLGLTDLITKTKMVVIEDKNTGE